MSVPSDAELVARIRAGDRAAFDALFRAHYARLVAFASRMLHSVALAEELVQDVFLGLWRQRTQWELRTSIETYLFGAVRNELARTRRRAQREQRYRNDVTSGARDDVTMHTSVPADAALLHDEVQRTIALAVAALPERCREAYLLRRQHGLSVADVAQIMGISPKTVEAQITIALKSLRTALAALREPGS